MVCGAGAVLTGLIFVAASMHLRLVLRDPWHGGRAGSSLLALTSTVLIAVAVPIPGLWLLPGAAIALGSSVWNAWVDVATDDTGQ